MLNSYVFFLLTWTVIIQYYNYNSRNSFIFCILVAPKFAKGFKKSEFLQI